MTTRNMDCTDIKALLSGLIDDQVDRDTRYAAERHLAECSACRAMLDEAERMNAAIAREAELAMQGGELPRDFQARVLASTVLADRGDVHGRLWINWTGWLAAAASLMLALTLLAMQLNGQRRPGHLTAASGETGLAAGGQDAGATATGRPAAGARLASFQPTFGFPPDQYEKVVFSPGAGAADSSAAIQGGDSEVADAATALAESDSQILQATLTAMSILMETDEARWSDDARFVQRVVEYDDLLARLDAARREVPQRDQGALFAARAALEHAGNGLPSLREIKELQNAVRGLNVMPALRRMSESMQRGASL